MKYSKLVIFAILFLNLIVLSGQLFPAYAPPFARTVNVIFLLATLAYFIVALVPKKTAP